MDTTRGRWDNGKVASADPRVKFCLGATRFCLRYPVTSGCSSVESCPSQMALWAPESGEWIEASFGSFNCVRSSGETLSRGDRGFNDALKKIARRARRGILFAGMELI